MNVYIVADHDMVYAESPEQALDLFRRETETDEFGVDDVEEVSGKRLDSQVWCQDEGKIIFDGKTVREIVSEYTEPQYMWGWE